MSKFGLPRARLWRAFPLTFVIITVVCYFAFLLCRLTKYHDSLDEARLHKHELTDRLTNKIAIRSQTIKTVAPSILVLLQQSPVFPVERENRLRNIDSTWARWLDSLEQTGIVLYATYFSLISPASEFIRLKTVLLGPHSKDFDPYFNMVKSYMILLSSTDFNWFVLANDHSFFVPQNLFCLLAALDSSLAIYTGNRLQRGIFKGYPLYFASGGAGAVFSHVALKMFIIGLAVSKDYGLKVFLDSHSNYTDYRIGSSSTGGEPCLNLFDFSRTGNTEFLHILGRIFRWRRDPCLMREDFSLEILLSPKVSVLLRRSGSVLGLSTHTAHREPRHRVNASRGSRERRSHLHGLRDVPDVEIKDLDAEKLSKCTSQTSWEKINPGLVIAYCIQAAFGAPFVSSVDSYGRERFNAFGVVRSLYGDVDEWYIESKHPFHLSEVERKNQTGLAPLISLSSKLVASDVISFHYVAEAEATLLYNLFSRRIQPNITVEELEAMWPKGPAAGPYSRSRFKDREEMLRLHHFLTAEAHVRRVEECVVMSGPV